ncbi:MAG: type II toxin-antitoxin system HicB family antitoxin [Microcystaceae cyanobacterium]
MMTQMSVIIEKDEDGYYAYCPQLEGCQSQGDTLEEIQDNIKEAIELYLSTLSQPEKEALLQQEIQTMMVEVKVA